MLPNSKNLKILTTLVILSFIPIFTGSVSAQTSGIPFSFLPREPAEIPTYVFCLDVGFMSHESRSLAAPIGSVTFNLTRVFSAQLNGAALLPTHAGSDFDYGYSFGASISFDLNPAKRQDSDSAPHKPVQRLQVGAGYTKLSAEGSGDFAEVNIPIAYVLVSRLEPLSDKMSIGPEVAIRGHWRNIVNNNIALERKNDIGAGVAFTLSGISTGFIGFQLRNEVIVFFREFRAEFSMSLGFHFRF